MARSRRGSFGLQPRVAPNVTNMVVAIAREYVASRDALIMDAWRNGGTFEGKKATDDMVLDYWQDRMKGLDKDDPTYEDAKNNVMQLQYAVEQSKADLLHVQGRMSDTQYANFFLKWAKKVPRNSEFYRTLQKDAAQLIEAAKERARIDGERARTEAFNNFVTTTTERNIAIGTALTEALDDLSKKTGLSITGNGDELLALLTQNVNNNPAQYRILLDAIKRGDPNFNGTFTEGYFAQAVKEATHGYDLIADRAQKGGYVTAYVSASQGMATMSSWGQNVKVWPAAETYTTVMQGFYKVANDPTASQMDIINAGSAASAQLSALAASPGIDIASKQMIEADALRLIGQDGGDSPSFGDALLGRNGVTPELTMTMGAWVQTAAEMKVNPAMWAYGPVDKNGNYDPTGNGVLGMVPAGSIPPGAQGVMVPGRNGESVLAMVMPHSVYAKDPGNPDAAPQLVGYRIDYNVGGRAIQLWGYKDNGGQSEWTLSSPLAPGVTETVDNKGDIYVTPSAPAATNVMEQAAAIDAQLGTNLVAQLQAQGSSGTELGSVSAQTNEFDQKTGTTLRSVEVKFANGMFTITEKKNTIDANGNIVGTQSTPIDIGTASDVNSAIYAPSRLAAGQIPGVTYTSPLQASVKAASFTQTQDQVSRFASDPAFQQAFLSQTMQTLGTQNPYDPRIAAAWQDVTTTKAGPVTPSPKSAAHRPDLRYPGPEKNPDAYASNLSINYGNGQTLNIPGLPSYLKDTTLTGGNNPWVANQNAQYTPLLSGLGITIPSQMPQFQGPPAPTVTPTPSPTNTTSGVTPTNLPTATPTQTTAVPTTVKPPTAITSPTGVGPNSKRPV